MGNTVLSSGKRSFDDNYSFPQDLNDLAQDIFDATMVRAGTSQARQDLPIARQKPGMLWVETDTVGSSTPRIMRTDGAGNWSDIMGGTIIPLTNFPGTPAVWEATSGFAPYLVVRGKTRTVYGAATRKAGGSLSLILTIPEGHRPAVSTFLPANATDQAVVYTPQVLPSGVLRVAYGGGSATGAYPLAGSWETA